MVTPCSHPDSGFVKRKGHDIAHTRCSWPGHRPAYRAGQSPYANRPVKFIVPFPAGGSVDTTGRVKLALTPDGGGSDSLARALPPQMALEMLLDGGVTTAVRLYDLGLVNRVVPHGEAFPTAMAWAHRLAAGPFDAQARIKQLVHAARGRTRRAQLDAERDAFVGSLYSDACSEGIASFLNARRA